MLIRSSNNSALVACWLSATKTGAVVVNTMPMLQAGELGKIIDKAQVTLVLCDTRLLAEMEEAAAQSSCLKRVVGFDGAAGHEAELDRAALVAEPSFVPVATGRDDLALLGFTSGSTGAPKATMHFHLDLLIIADSYAKQVLRVVPEDVFFNSLLLAFTFGLDGLTIFPVRFDACAVLMENASPSNLVAIIEAHRATISFTAPTVYRDMLAAMESGADPSSLRLAVSAEERLLAPVFNQWMERTGKPILNGMGATEMLHIFISNTECDLAPSRSGRPLAGYEARVVDLDGREVPRGTVGHLTVRGPVGCRYMDDERQREYVRDGWNITRDAFHQEEDGSFVFAARTDDMIMSAGHNIAGPKVEVALLKHLDVPECAVASASDVERG